MIEGLQKAENEANAAKDQNAARIIHHYLRLRLENVKEQMVDDGSELLRGRAQELRTLIKRLTAPPIPTDDTDD